MNNRRNKLEEQTIIGNQIIENISVWKVIKANSIIQKQSIKRIKGKIEKEWEFFCSLKQNTKTRNANKLENKNAR